MIMNVEVRETLEYTIVAIFKVPSWWLKILWDLWFYWDEDNDVILGFGAKSTRR